MHPILVQIPTPWGAIPIYSYGVMLGLSLIVAWYFIMYWGHRKEGLDRELMANCFIVTAIVAIVGARLLYVLTNLDRFDNFADWFAFRSGGLVAYGGFLGGLLGSWLYLRAKGVPLLAWADIAAPTLGLGLMFTRVGCYLYGCDFGAPLRDDAPGALHTLGTFPKWDFATGEGPKLLCDQTISGSPAFSHHVAEYDLPATAAASLPVHPTQIYESLAGLALFGVAMLVWRHRQFRGQVILALAAGYAVWRFLIEYVRDDPQRGEAFGFSTSQLISLALLPLLGFTYLAVQRRFRAEGDPPIPASAQEGGASKAAEAGESGTSSSARKVRKAKAKRRK
jgi:phosphatidylglycerol---prolipoprotein diacylglyceryl transferase